MEEDAEMLNQDGGQQQENVVAPEVHADLPCNAKRTLEDAGLNEVADDISRTQKRARNTATEVKETNNAAPDASSGITGTTSKKGKTAIEVKQAKKVTPDANSGGTGTTSKKKKKSKKKKGDKYDLGEKWRGVIINDNVSPLWDPSAYPPPGPQPKDPPQSTIRYSIAPEPRPDFQAALRRQLKKYVTGGFPVMGKPVSFTKEGSSDQWQYPDIQLLWRSGQRVVDICYATRAQAAYAGQMEQFAFPIQENDWPRYKLRKLQAGLCHPDDLISIEMTPEVDHSKPASTVPASAYKAAVEILLVRYPKVTCVGAWRSIVQWDEKNTQFRPVMLLVLRTEPDFQPLELPGFIRSISKNEEVSDNVDDFWFHLQHGWRRKFCPRCRDVVHEPRNCSQNICDKCSIKGHTSADCPWKGSRSSFLRWHDSL